MGNGVITRLRNLVSQPITTQQDLIQWALVTVVAITIAFAWSRVLRNITEG